MCSKDNLACAARRENKSCWAQEEVAIVVWTPASGNLPAPRFRLNDQSIFRNCDRASLLTYDFNYKERKERWLQRTNRRIAASLHNEQWPPPPRGRRRVVGCQSNGTTTQSAEFAFCLYPLCRGARKDIGLSSEASRDLSLLSPRKMKARRRADRISSSSQIRN